MPDILDPYGRPFQVEERANLRNPIDEWLRDSLVGGSPSTSGERVNARLAMNIMAFFACVKNISEDLAKLPWKARRRMGRGNEDAPDYALSKLLRHPNDYTDRHTFRQTLIAHALTHHGGFAEIVTGGDGRPESMHLIDPTTVTVDTLNGRIVYHVTMGRRFVTLMQHEVFHLHGLGFDGVTGYSVSNLAKQLLGATIALQKYQGAYFGNSAIPSGILEHPASLSTKALEHLREQFAARYAGADNRGKPLLIEEGMKFSPISTDPEKSQMLELTKVNWLDIFRIFRMPPYKAGFTEGVSLSSLEQQDRQYHTDCLDPWRDRIVSESDMKLIPKMDRDIGYHTHITMAALKRADIQVQDAHFKEGFYTGRYSINDIRAWEDLNPIEGGDRRFTQRNLIPLDRLDELLDTEMGAGIEPPDSGDEQPSAGQPTEDAPAADRSTACIAGVIELRIAQLLRAEADKAARATDIEERYAKEHEYIIKAMTEIIGIVSPAFRDDVDAKDVAARYAAIHCEKSIADVLVGDVTTWQNGQRAKAATQWVMEQMQ